jgi:hypothetical protein
MRCVLLVLLVLLCVLLWCVLVLLLLCLLLLLRRVLLLLSALLFTQCKFFWLFALCRNSETSSLCCVSSGITFHHTRRRVRFDD